MAFTLPGTLPTSRKRSREARVTLAPNPTLSSTWRSESGPCRYTASHTRKSVARCLPWESRILVVYGCLPLSWRDVASRFPRCYAHPMFRLGYGGCCALVCAVVGCGAEPASSADAKAEPAGNDSINSPSEGETPDTDQAESDSSEVGVDGSTPQGPTDGAVEATRESMATSETDAETPRAEEPGSPPVDASSSPADTPPPSQDAGSTTGPAAPSGEDAISQSSNALCLPSSPEEVADCMTSADCVQDEGQPVGSGQVPTTYIICSPAGQIPSGPGGTPPDDGASDIECDETWCNSNRECVDGVCVAKRCDAEGAAQCEANSFCSPADPNADEVGCVPKPCGDDYSCLPWMQCDSPNAKADSHGCAPIDCGAHTDCPCGFCVEGRCENRAGRCVEYSPLAQAP